MIRKRVEHAVDALAARRARSVVLHRRACRRSTLIYKGMLTADQIEPMFPDLARSGRRVGARAGAPALQHQHVPVVAARAPVPLHRAQRRDQHAARQHQLDARARRRCCQSTLLGDDLKKILPIIREGGSDTATFDNVLEFLVMTGRSLPHAILMMIPEPWAGHETMTRRSCKAFYEYHSSLMEPWDGPASIAFTDGTVIGAVLDRNGLRPSRYYVTKDDLVIMASEVGVLDIPPENILLKERLHPGRIFLVDTGAGPHRRRRGDQARARARRSPYGEWLDENLVDIDDLPAAPYLPPPESRDRAAAASRRSATRTKICACCSRRWRGNGEEADRLDGHRHAARRAVGPAAAALRLLQAALRAGHQPAARRDPRGAGDVDGIDDRARGQPARAAARVVPADRASSTRSSTTTSWRSCATSTSPGSGRSTLPMLFDPQQDGAGPRAGAGAI